ncbi:MAG: hypothetical protein JNL64_04105 [Blastocatellia bacterium]|nr:hypothetical protein [Blastocatellia bacterium]
MKGMILPMILCLLTVTHGQSTKAAWESKDVDKWDSTDIGAIMFSSAWGRNLTIGNMTNVPNFGSIQQSVRASYSLRSALVVRFALIRQLQLEQKYDAMDEKAKAQFDKRYRDILQCPPCSEYYIFSLRGDSQELRNSALIEARQKQIFLSNEKGEKRTLARFSPQTATPGSEALFFFKRKDDKGVPLISPDSKKLIFSLALPEIDRDSPLSLLKFIEINVADIVREGVVVF